MASVSVSHLVLFIAGMIVAGGIAGVVIDGTGRLSEAIDDDSENRAEEIRTDIEVISVPSAGVYDREGAENVTLLVKNVGTNTLVPRKLQLDVMVDGTYQNDVHVESLESDGGWGTGDVVRITIDVGALSDGVHRVKLHINGNHETFVFRVGSGSNSTTST